MPLTHFHDVDFPMPMREGLQCRLRFLTEIAQTRSQQEQRHCAWFDPIWEIDLETVIVDQAAYDDLLDFWRARKGASFRFRHPLDSYADNVQVGTGDGTTTEYQLLQAYQSGIAGDTYTARRVVFLPVADASFSVTLNDIPTTAYTLNTTTGVLTLDSAPAYGVVVRWSGYYDLLMRLTAQEMPTTLAEVGRFDAPLRMIEDRASAAVAPGVAEETIPLTVEARLPLEMAEGSVTGPVHRILVLTGENEIAERIDTDAGSRFEATLGYRHRPWAEARRLIAFFWGRRGRYASFNVFDPADHSFLSPSSWGTGTGALATFPIYKVYGDAAASESRRIYRPVSGIVPSIDGFAQSSGFCVDTALGTVTFDPPPDPGAAIAGTVEVFDTLARFDTDALEITLDYVDVASVQNLSVVAIEAESIPVTYQAGQTGKPTFAPVGCGVAVTVPPTPPPLGVEFGHSFGSGHSILIFTAGQQPVPGIFDFYKFLVGYSALTTGMVFSHASTGVLMDLGGPNTSDFSGSAWGNGRYAPMYRLGLAGAGDGQLVYGTPREIPVDASALTVYGRAGSGGAYPEVLGDPCGETASINWRGDLGSDCIGVIGGGQDNRIGPKVAGVVPDVTVLIATISLASATLYVSGTLYGTKILIPSSHTPTWFEYFQARQEAGCIEVTRTPTQQWYRQDGAVFLREPYVGGYRNDDFVSTRGGGRFILYEMLMELHNFATAPRLPTVISLLTPANNALEEVLVLQTHQNMLRYFAHRYQLGLTPGYNGHDVLGHWTTNQLEGGMIDFPIGTWGNYQSGMDLVGPVGGNLAPLLRAVDKPTIPLSKTLRLFNGNAVLEGFPLTEPVGS